MKEEQENKVPFMEKMAAFIVEKRNLFIFLHIALFIFSLVSSNWVKVCNDITEYLPDNSKTKTSLSVMENFKTYSSARIMVMNINYDEAEEIEEKLKEVPCVNNVTFDDTEDHYKDAAALFDVSVNTTDDEPEKTEKNLDEVEKAVSGYDYYIDRSYEDTSKELDNEMNTVLVVAAVIILLVLTLTSGAYMEVPALLITFIAAAILNKGTNYLCGEISFVSNSVTVVLQLALSIDYAIMLIHRYNEERAENDVENAVIKALAKSIPSISASSLTTVSGLAALMFMQFKIGFDMGLVLIKAIILSLVSVFTLMPCVLIFLGKYIDKTHHKSFVPKVSFLGKLANKCKKIVPPIFIVILIAAYFVSSKCNYAYGTTTLETSKKNESTIATETINAEFGESNPTAVMVPSGNYDKEKKLIRELENMPEVKSVMGIANIEAKDGYCLGDSVTPRQFSELAGIEIEQAKLLYSLYAVEESDYGKVIGSLEDYKIPLIDIFSYVYDMKTEGIVKLDDELSDSLDDLNSQLSVAKDQLKSEKYSRILIYMNLPEEGKETFAFMEKLQDTLTKYYKENYMAGNSTSDYDLAESFKRDNLLTGVLSIVFVLIVLFFTFNSAGIPLLLILVIQGSIWINFSAPVMSGTNIYFLSYLIVSSIQMGANIDYAIVISERYVQLKKEMPLKDAMVKTIELAFPTILTSGSILASAGFLIGRLSTNPIIASIGVCLCRGTLISIFLVLCVLPAILMLGDFIIERTSFTIKRPENISSGTGIYMLNGRVRGYVNGIIDADIKGVVRGDIKAQVNINNIKEQTDTGQQNLLEEGEGDKTDED